MRKLARIERILNISPIPGADAIEVATVQNWKVVTKKGEYKVGDLCIYCEIDSFLPIREEFEFLRKSSYRNLQGNEGFRLKTIKLRGQVSQGLLLPLSILGDEKSYSVGDEVTADLGIVKYEPPLPPGSSGTIKGAFPSFVPKTDEERVQNLTEEYETYKNQVFYITEKLDGTSITCYFNDGEFGVCQRNYELEETENMYWDSVKKLNIREKLTNLNKNIALQGELIGPYIQGNPYKLMERGIRFFSAFNIDTYQYFNFEQFFELAKELEIETVPLLATDYKLPETIDELIAIADGPSVLHKDTIREGIVLRSKEGERVSFKAISNNFLLNEK